MKKLNFEKLSKSMSFEEKANLIFADFNLKCGTMGKKRLLTPKEEDAIFEDLRSKKQIREMNRLNDYYNLIRRCVVNLNTWMLCLDLQTSKLSSIVVGIFLSQNIRDELPKKASQKVKKGDSFFCWFYPPEAGNEDANSQTNREPNIDFQLLFHRALQAHRFLLKGIYTVEVLQKRNEGIQFLDDVLLELIEDAKNKAIEFEEMDFFCGVLEVYQKADELGLLRKKGFSVPEFEEFFFHPEKAFELTEEDKDECEETIRYWLENM